MPAMLEASIFTKTQGGLISTLFFFTYGIGQLVGGFFGDKFSPQKLVFIGIVMTAITNISMCLSISGSVGTIIVYILTASILSQKSWQYVFIIIGIILLVVSIIWIIVYKIVDKNAKNKGIEYIVEDSKEDNIKHNIKDTKNEKFNWFNIIISSGIIFLLFCLVVQGTLKNGITSWVPVYVYETYNIGDDMSALSTVIIPIFNIFVVYFASLANKVFKDEIKSSALFFLLCAISLFILYTFSGKNIVISLLMLAISTTAMTAVNTLLLVVLPINFEKINKSASIYGILNSSVYVGTTISTYGIGTLSDDIGWTKTIMVLIILAIISLIVCMSIIKKWQDYKLKNL